MTGQQRNIPPIRGNKRLPFAIPKVVTNSKEGFLKGKKGAIPQVGLGKMEYGKIYGWFL